MLGAVCLVLAGAVAALVVLVFSDTSKAGLSKDEYFAKVTEICAYYGPQLSQIETPSDFAVPGTVAEPIREALPLLNAETRELRALEPPKELADEIERWLALRDRAIALLRKTLHDANLPDIRLLGPDWVRFLARNKAARAAAADIGIPSVCSRRSA